MSVYLPAQCKTFYYDFQWRGRRYTGTTHQTRRDDAALVESQLKIRLRQHAAGIAAFDPKDTPRFHGIDERTAVANYVEMIRFYHRLIQNTADSEGQ